MAQVSGEIQALRPTQLRQLQSLERLRCPQGRWLGGDLQQRLVSCCLDLGRMVALLMDRRGVVTHIALGSPERVWMPELGRAGAGPTGQRKLRLVVVQPPKPGMLTVPADLKTDLTRLRLDALILLRAAQAGGLDRGALVLPRYQTDGTIETEETHSQHPGELLALDPNDPLEILDASIARLPGLRRIEGPAWALVGVHTGRRDAARFEELRELARTAGIEVVHECVQRRRRIDPKTVIGSGRLEDLVLECLERNAEGIIFDRDLSPRQLANLANATELKVLDRSQLILEIFARHASTAEARVQVELAQLRYNLPRIIERSTGLSRLAGGIGGRGPGETALEVNRRRVRERIRRLEKQLKKRSSQREVRRKSRARSGLKRVAIVGYTNAGKSTLMNQLTRSDVLVEDQLFATLDPASRRWLLRKDAAHEDPRQTTVVLSDTVGFIEDLPQELVEAFRSTLEELRDADLLLHVVVDAEADGEKRAAAVERILKEIHCDSIPRVLVENKCDLSGRPAGQQTLYRVRVSALEEMGLDDLRAVVCHRLPL